MNLFGWEDNVPIENRMVSRSVEAAQSRVEGYNFEIRKHLVDYDDVVNTHRDVIYKLRRRVLEGEELRPTIMEYVGKELDGIVAARLQGDPSSWDAEGFHKELKTVFPSLEVLNDEEELTSLRAEEVKDELAGYAEQLYDRRTQEFGPETMKALERAIMLRTIDTEWVEHLTAMENMRQGIGLEAVGQRDPLVSYKRQAYEMFGGLISGIESTVARTIFKVALGQPQQQQQASQAPSRQPPQAQAWRPAAQAPRPHGRQVGVQPSPGKSGPAAAHPAPVSPAASTARAAQVISGRPTVMSAVTRGHGSDTGAGKQKVGRNDPCPCGSGKKYKRCHGAG